jgi:hypothetical protein
MLTRSRDLGAADYSRPARIALASDTRLGSGS